jgi:phosphohistidine swiveling domain-containing protein
MSARLRRLRPLGGGMVRGGAKAARLSAALRAGFPVLPGWVVPSAESRPAVLAAAAVLRAGQLAAGRRAVLSHPSDPVLVAELREAAARLGGRVVVRSSSHLEADPRWSGAFSTVAGVGPDEVMTAVRSCWASAFAVDPLARLDACGLPPEALELGLLLQPEICPPAGGVARVQPPAPGGRGAGAGSRATGTAEAGSRAPGATFAPAPAGQGSVEVIVEGIEGHPGPLLAGWADGASARVCLPRATEAESHGDGSVSPAADGPLLDLLGRDLVISVARLAEGVRRCLGDETIEWAAHDGQLWLLQSGPGQPALADLSPGPHSRSGSGSGSGPGPGHAAHPDPGPAFASVPGGTRAAHAAGVPCRAGEPGRHLAAREWMPLLGAAVQEHGRHLRGRPVVAGQAAGRLVACRPHERPPAASRDAILLIDRPLPALAPLLFTARGVLARSGAAGSHLAEVARSLAVPMVAGCRPETVTGAGPPGASWLAAIDGATGDVALLQG